MIRDEHDAFQEIIRGLRISKEAAETMARFRPDQRNVWLKLAEVYGVCATTAYKLGEEAGSRIVKN